MKKRKRRASLMQLSSPEYLSLVTNPANKTGFKIIRSAEEVTAARGDDSLLSIDFPPGITREAAYEIFDIMGLADDYELMEDDVGNFYMVRNGLKREDIEGTVLDMGHGFAATVRLDEKALRADGAVSGVKLVRMEFAKSFTLDDVKTWLDDKEVDFQPNGVAVADNGTVVTRHESVGGEQQIQIMPGILGFVVRAAEDDVPDSISREVVEQAYGNFGWGHLSFASAVADVEFTNKSWDAISILREVLEAIVFDSQLPLEERKGLIRNACTQYAAYATNLIDVLPTGVITQMRNDRNSTRETENMTKKAETADQTDEAAAAAATDETATTEEVTRTDDASTEEAGTETAAAADEAASTEEVADTITRAEVEKLVTDTVTEAVTAAFAAQAEQATRSDESAEEAESPTGAEALAGQLATFGETMKDISDKVERMSENFTSIKQEVEELAGATVGRSDDEDAATTEQAKRADESPFTGLFGSQPFNL